jgi:hypothetical protein
MPIEAGLDWTDCPPDPLIWIQLREQLLLLLQEFKGAQLTALKPIPIHWARCDHH